MTKKISVEQEAKLARLRSGFTVQVFESIDGKEPKWAFVGSAKNLKSLGDLIAAIPSTVPIKVLKNQACPTKLLSPMIFDGRMGL